MKFFELAKILENDCIEYIGNDTDEFFGVCYDSRNIIKNQLFLCIKGEKVDGHDFVQKAKDNGAAGIVCEKRLECNFPQIVVKNSVRALQKYAVWHKSQFDIKTIAITGSVGKTTTKEFISAVLSEKYMTHKNSGNQNSEIGLPMTILGLSSEHQAMVLEMGMSDFGEISMLSEIAKPDISVITNIGFSHIEFLKTQENILKAKLEIVDGMKSGSLLIINGDDPFLDNAKVRNDIKIVKYGILNKNCDYFAKDIILGENSTYFTAVTPVGEFFCEIKVQGIHNIYNALSAAATGVAMNVSSEKIIDGLKNFQNAVHRQNIYDYNGVTIIDDCYNASPTSVIAAVDVLKTYSGRKIAVLGDMLELGKFSEELHEKTGEQFENIDILFCYGNYAEKYVLGVEKSGKIARNNCFSYKNTDETAEQLIKTVKKGDIILFKASRSMKAETIIEKLKVANIKF